MPLFEVAILEVPSKSEAEKGETEKLVFGPVHTIARDSQSAAISAILDGGEKASKINRERMQVLVRPFA